MDIITIFQTLLRWGIPAFIGGVIFLSLFIVVYPVYKKVLHGKRDLTKVQLVSAVLLFCWMLLVLGLTSWSRGANFTGSFNIDLLSGYISAWNNWSISELQLILFNMLMFAPLGVLLPLLWKGAEKLWITLIVSLAVSASIEVYQLFTGTGIFELDDLLHNLIGSLFGYFCIMAVLTMIRERSIRPAPIAKALLIPCVIGLTLGVVTYVYHSRPYGNMSIQPAVRQDMSSIRIIADLRLSDHEPTASVYQNIHAEDLSYIQDIRSALATSEGLTFSKIARREDENIGYTGTGSNGTAFQTTFFFRTGGWHHTTSSSAARSTDEEIQQARERYENWMQELDLLPKDVTFSVQNGDTLRWDIDGAPAQDLSTRSGPFQQGLVLIQLDGSGALCNFLYLIDWNEYVAKESIISEQEAFAQVEAGYFSQYVPFQPGDTLYVNECELTYLYDTKGFYRPVYEFRGYLNDVEDLWSCYISAIAG